MVSDISAQRADRTISMFRRNALALSAVLISPLCSRAESPRDLLKLSIAELGTIKVDTVSGASRFTEKVTDAASSVTIVTRDEIAKLGHRTLADILRSSRSFDASYDRTYNYTGTRGFNGVGDYGSRILLLVDGHRMNDPIYDTAAIGTDALLDVDLIERVELIRGPGTANYGSNAFFGVINVVTRNGASVNGVETSASRGSLDTYSGRLTIGKSLPNGIDYLFSASTYASKGQERLFYSEYNSPATNRGIALNQDDDRFWSAFGKISYSGFTLQGGYVTRDKNIPTASYGSIFNTPNFNIDSRGYIELRYSKETDDGWTLGGRAFYDFYDYTSIATYDDGEGPNVFNESARARWWGIEANASKTFLNDFRLSLVVDMRKSCELTQQEHIVSPFKSITNLSGEHLSIGTYGEIRWQINPKLNLGAGLRWDHFDSFGETVNPRASLVWKPRESTSIKLLYGEAFRAPNNSQIDYFNSIRPGSEPLQPEKVRTYELVTEHYLDTHWKGTVSVFNSEITSRLDDFDEAGKTIYFNNQDALSIRGIETEIEGKWDNGWLFRASYTRQMTYDDTTCSRLVNSPENVAKMQLSAPLYSDKLFGAVELLYSSGRCTVDGKQTSDALVVNATLFSRELRPGLELSASVYNVLDQKYGIPGGEQHRQDIIEQDGRTFRVKISQSF